MHAKNLFAYQPFSLENLSPSANLVFLGGFPRFSSENWTVPWRKYDRPNSSAPQLAIFPPSSGGGFLKWRIIVMQGDLMTRNGIWWFFFCVTPSITHRIHAWYFTYIWLNFMLNVGKLIYHTWMVWVWDYLLPCWIVDCCLVMLSVIQYNLASKGNFPELNIWYCSVVPFDTCKIQTNMTQIWLYHYIRSLYIMIH